MSLREQSTVSVCIPAYNGAAVIGNALESAMRQDHAPLEILVLDNHSTDDTWRIVSEIAADDPRVRCIRHPENIGMARNFAACVSCATGEYVQILSADDVLESGCVSVLAAALDENPAAVLAAGARVFTDENLREKRIVRARPGRESVPGSKLIHECFVRGNVIGEPSAVMFRREGAIRGFSVEYSQAVDLEMWFHLLGSGPGILLPIPVARIRQHDAQTTRENIRSGRIIHDKRLLFRQYGERLIDSLSVFDKLSWDVRMASSVARFRCAGGANVYADIGEVFFKPIFRSFLVPLLTLALKLGGRYVSQRL